MEHDKDMISDQALDALLDDLARDAADPSEALLGRVLEDAYTEQPEPQIHSGGNVVSIFGGWSGVGGLALAASVGFFMGFNPPAALQDPLSIVIGDEAALFDEDASVSGFGWDLEEDLSG